MRVQVLDSRFGRRIDMPIDRSGLILVSELTRHGLKPLRVLLPHQLYLHDVLAIQGDVVVTAIPIARDHLNVSAALREQIETEAATSAGEHFAEISPGKPHKSPG